MAGDGTVGTARAFVPPTRSMFVEDRNMIKLSVNVEMVDFEDAYRAVGDSAVVCGNLDPVSVIQNLSADAVAEKAAGLVSRYGNKKFILSGGCEITVNTPVKNLAALKKAAG